MALEYRARAVGTSMNVPLVSITALNIKSALITLAVMVVTVKKDIGSVSTFS